MKLSANVQRILNALSFAGAGENLSLRQKGAVLADAPATIRAVDFTPPIAASDRAQLALYLGSELPADVMDYVIRTCSRLNYGLTVLTLQSRKDATELLAAHQSALDEAGVIPQIQVLSGDPARALTQALRRRPDVAFLVCNESGYLSRSLMNGTQNSLPVPVVLVSRTEAPVSAEIKDNAHDSAPVRAAR